MNLAVIVDIVIGLALVYSAMGGIASSIQEFIASIFAWRGTYLTKGIDVIVDNSADAKFAWNGFSDWFQAHFTSSPGVTAAEKWAAAVAAGKIDPKDPAQATLKRVLDVVTHPLLRGTPSNLPSYVPARNFGSALLDVLRDGSDAPVFGQFQAEVAKLPDGDLKTVLLTFLHEAKGDVDQFRARVEKWFDDAMDRVTGVYRRLTQYVMLILGLALAVGLNVDTIHVVNMLWQSPDSAYTLASSANQAVDHAPAMPVQPSAQTGVQAGGAGDVTAQVGTVMTEIRSLQADNLPIGWSAKQRGPFGPFTILGWLITALAISLGGPFWFDLLQKIGNFRVAGPPPADASSSAAEK
jgi:hypothetical protein